LEVEQHIHAFRDELEGLSKSSEDERFWTGSVFPATSVRERWATLTQVDHILRTRSVTDGFGHEFPPHRNGNERREWGIANGLYHKPWILTKSGAFLFSGSTAEYVGS
jgi:hypothetical protein